MSDILIVDDERSIRKTFDVFLSKEGHTVHLAENVEAAFSIIDKNDLDLVITDIIMPHITGIDLLEKIAANNPELPVIIMTGEPTIETARQAVRDSAFDYLIKPINKEMLLRAVRKALEYKSLLNKKRKLEIENKKYREDLEKLVTARTKALQNAMNATVTTLSLVLELRDLYTAGHQKRVGNLAVAIAKKMKLKKQQVDCLYVTGYLHDLGKIAVPAEILSKPSLLNGIEYEMVKTHSTRGYEVLKNVDFPWPVAEVVYQHHERIDGSGYPRGLKGDKIKIEAKIIAVADVIEAMTSHRPYRPSLGVDAALKEIEKNSGILYDRKVAKVALNLFRKDNYEFADVAQEVNFEL